MTVTHSPRLFFGAAFAAILSSTGLAQAANQVPLAPTHANVAYGEHPNQVFDFWAATTAPAASAPLVVFIHGGGFTSGSKDKINAAAVRALLAAGIHVASVEYRLLKHAKLPAAHEDARRALQVLRTKAVEWKIDKSRIGAYGGSAGAQLVAYLAWHDDMADPESDDPVARESTRLAAVAPLSGQSTMDLDWWVENIPGYDRYHTDPRNYSDLQGEARTKLMTDLSIINLISADDPPVFMRYGMKPEAPIPVENAGGWKIHHVNFGLAMEQKLQSVGVEVVLAYPSRKIPYKSEVEFLIEKLR